jgi:hypothetical protein
VTGERWPLKTSLGISALARVVATKISCFAAIAEAGAAIAGWLNRSCVCCRAAHPPISSTTARRQRLAEATRRNI